MIAQGLDAGRRRSSLAKRPAIRQSRRWATPKRSPSIFWPRAPPNSQPQASPHCWCSGRTPPGTAVMRCQRWFRHHHQQGKQGAGGDASGSARCPAQVRGAIPSSRHGSTASGLDRNRTVGGVPPNSQRVSMPPMTVRVKRPWSCPKRSFDSALGPAGVCVLSSSLSEPLLFAALHF